MTLGVPAACLEWREAKLKQLANGYATAWDQRETWRIRRREKEGYLTTEQQVAFCRLVEAITSPRQKG